MGFFLNATDQTNNQFESLRKDLWFEILLNFSSNFAILLLNDFSKSREYTLKIQQENWQ